MTYANAIATTEARLPDGSVVAYRDADPSHVRQARFQHILDGNPLEFAVVTEDGERFGVDLVSAAFLVGEERITPPTPPAPLRLIYYKRMEGGFDAETGSSQTIMVFFVVGWQTTVEGRNFKLGLKVFPSERRYEVTEDI